jgi:hypothetical protein
MREFFFREEESDTVKIEVNLDIDDTKEYNPWLLSIFIKYDALNEDAEGYEEFLETKEALIISLAHNQRAKYVGSRMLDGWSELYFYSYDSKRLDRVVKEILAPSEYIYESNIVRDTKWDLYELQLLPNELELSHIESMKVISMLEEEGDMLEIAREVEHYVSFLTPTQKERFIENVENIGFLYKDEIESETFEHGVAVVKKHSLLVDDVEKNVTLLFQAVKKAGGFYEGWSTTLVNE